MSPWQRDALIIDLLELHADCERLARLMAPRRRRSVAFPRLAGGPEPDAPVRAGQVLEVTLGAMASAHRKLQEHGFGLSTSEPMAVRMNGELATFDHESGLAWVRLRLERRSPGNE